MGEVGAVLDSLWQRRLAFLRRSPRPPRLAVYLDSDTLTAVASHLARIGYIGARPSGRVTEVFGMPVHEVVGCGRHVRVVEVVDG